MTSSSTWPGRIPKCENIHLRDYAEALCCPGRRFPFFNPERPHERLKNRPSVEVYTGLRRNRRKETMKGAADAPLPTRGQKDSHNKEVARAGTISFF